MRRTNTKLLLTACEMSFNGKTDAEVAADLENVCLKCVALAENIRSGKSLKRNSSRRIKSHCWKRVKQPLTIAHPECACK